MKRNALYLLSYVPKMDFNGDDGTRTRNLDILNVVPAGIRRRITLMQVVCQKNIKNAKSLICKDIKNMTLTKQNFPGPSVRNLDLVVYSVIIFYTAFNMVNPTYLKDNDEKSGSIGISWGKT